MYSLLAARASATHIWEGWEEVEKEEEGIKDRSCGGQERRQGVEPRVVCEVSSATAATPRLFVHRQARH